MSGVLFSFAVIHKKQIKHNLSYRTIIIPAYWRFTQFDCGIKCIVTVNDVTFAFVSVDRPKALAAIKLDIVVHATSKHFLTSSSYLNSTFSNIHIISKNGYYTYFWKIERLFR